MYQGNLKVNEPARGGLNVDLKFNIDFRTVEMIYCM